MARPVSIIELTTQESQELHRRVQASTTTRRDICGRGSYYYERGR